MPLQVTQQATRTCAPRTAVNMAAFMHKETTGACEIRIEGGEDTLRTSVQHALLTGDMPDMVHAAGMGTRPQSAARVPWQGGAITIRWPEGGREQALASARSRQQRQQERVAGTRSGDGAGGDKGKKRTRREWCWQEGMDDAAGTETSAVEL